MRQLAARLSPRFKLTDRPGGALLVTALVLVVAASISACSSDDDGGEQATAITWCQARQVLADRCQRCHSGAGLHGAPFALETYDDTQVEVAGRKRWELMQSAVEDETMPPTGIRLEPPAEKPTAAERELLLEWFAQGAKPLGGVACD